MKIVPPNRVERSYVQHLVAPPATVMPLLCPVREADWIPGWDPRLVVSGSGVVEPGCVFVTAAEPVDAVWVVTRHEPESGFVEMWKITPTVTACRLTIRLRAAPHGCDAEVTYTHTSIGPAGDALVAGFTEEHYRAFMHDWEARLNHYLRHGRALGAGDG
jgi:hypothetical protein